ncbi:hypothetical protein CVT26_015673 [Gymnopilus dilepis]|uniref:Uncharacterized protein n=1 Tax=Gymnopilus dilepis TaxID=231916 RepID=A0A409VFD0_9AGAR|nr:hypothetical protein CVT26_015673 [Gymnopilus dilepis]
MGKRSSPKKPKKKSSKTTHEQDLSNPLPHFDIASRLPPHLQGSQWIVESMRRTNEGVKREIEQMSSQVREANAKDMARLEKLQNVKRVGEEMIERFLRQQKAQGRVEENAVAGPSREG